MAPNPRVANAASALPAVGESLFVGAWTDYDDGDLCEGVGAERLKQAIALV